LNTVPGAGAEGDLEIDHVINRFLTVLKPESLAFDREAVTHYASSLSGTSIKPCLIVYPESEEQIVAVVRIAREEGLHLHTVSCGKNFGYGSAQGTSCGQVIVDLNRMCTVLIASTAS